MKTSFIKRSALGLLAIALIIVAPAKANSQEKPKKIATWTTGCDTIVISPWDSNIIFDFKGIPNGEKVAREIRKNLRMLDFSADSIDQAFSKEMRQAWFSPDSLNDQFYFPNIQFFVDDSDLFMDSDTAGGQSQQVEVEQFDSSNPKEMAQILKKLEVEGKLPPKGEYDGVQVYSITRGDSTKRRILLQPKGEKNWIDAATGKPTNKNDFDIFTTKTQKHVYLFAGKGKKTNDFDAEKIVVNAKGDKQIKIIISDGDSTKVIEPKGKTALVWINSSSIPENKKMNRMAKQRVETTVIVTNPSKEDLAMLEKSGIKRGNLEKEIPEDNITIQPNVTKNSITIGFTAKGKGNVMVKIADGNGKILANDSQGASPSFSKSYSFDAPMKGDYFIQVSFDGKSAIRKVSIK